MNLGELVNGFLFIAVFLVALPITLNLSSPIGLLIIGFALWEAFKINRKARVNITGPHEVGQGPASVYV